MYKELNFEKSVLQICKKIPKGRVSTYKEIAITLNSKAYRAVGNALNKNPYGAFILGFDDPDMVPCHRVINSDGKIGGFVKGVDTKIELLKKEGIEIKDNKIDLKKYFFKLST